jgi:hypothetical protein
MKGKANRTRREFLGMAGAGAAMVAIVPRHVLAGSGETSPNEKLSIYRAGGGQAEPGCRRGSLR